MIVGLYGKYVLPRLIHVACSSEPATRQREKIVPLATGEVLEVGIGSGLNLPFYDPARVSVVRGLDPSPELIERAMQAAAELPIDVEFTPAGAEEIPFEDARFDTIVMTYTLCSIPEAERAVREMVRVLRPGGALLFCEHGAAPDRGVRKRQDRLDPIWRRVAGGCHLNRDIPRILRRGGFELNALETMYLPGWRPGSFNYWGRATPANGRTGAGRRS